MAKRFRGNINRRNRIMAAACILMLMALAATIFFGEKSLKDRENKIRNYGAFMTWGETS